MDDADVDGDADPRRVELDTLEAIFPEMKRAGFAFDLELPVIPAQPITVSFSTERARHADPANASNTSLPSATVQRIEPTEPTESLMVSHLPSLSMKLTLPDAYPSEQPPQVSLSVTPQWLPSEKLRALENEGSRLWEDMGRDMIAYTYIDHLQREAENTFGLLSANGTMMMNPEHRLAVLDFNIKAQRAAFERETFDCGICLEPKKGLKCHKMTDCGHIFCIDCLQDFYNNAIKDGNLSTVRCLAPSCAKERAAKSDSGGKRKTVISPGELLQIGLSEDTVKRYVTLKYKTELEADKDTIYCPRAWCNGAAESAKRKKPEGLNFAEYSGDEPKDSAPVTGEATATAMATSFDPADFLRVCEDCGFAFCSRCLQTWHGIFVRCAPKRNKDELTEEEKASLEYLQLHTSPCPTCNAPAQKTRGCNHMICPRCETHFCYLCSSWLDPANPYKHYNQQPDGKVTPCHMRLWELEAGDGDDVGQGFEGGRQAREPQIIAAGPAGNLHPNLPIDLVDEINLDFWWVEDPDDDDDGAAPAPPQPLAGDNANPVGLARLEANVFRLPHVEQRPPAAPARAQRGQQPRGRAAAGRGGARGRGRGRHDGAIGNRGRGQQPPVPRGARGGRPARRGAAPRRGAAQQHHQRQEPRQQLPPEENLAAYGLPPDQAAWVQEFVRLALVDNEDEMDDSDSDADFDDVDWGIMLD